MIKFEKEYAVSFDVDSEVITKCTLVKEDRKYSFKCESVFNGNTDGLEEEAIKMQCEDAMKMSHELFMQDVRKEGFLKYVKTL